MRLDDGMLQVVTHDGPGYEPLVDFGAWRVALMNRDDEHTPEGITFLERHKQTDEVFVLLSGNCILYIGEGAGAVERIEAVVMEPGRLYNVRKAVWHNCAFSADARVLIVENRDTSKDNSDRATLSESQRAGLERLPG